jgi:hypothetical protein
MPVVLADTAGSAKEVAELGDTTRGAIASELAADIYGLKSLRKDVEDDAHNTTRFLIMAKEPIDIELEDGPAVTTFIFRVRNVPAALYKVLGHRVLCGYRWAPGRHARASCNGRARFLQPRGPNFGRLSGPSPTLGNLSIPIA